MRRSIVAEPAVLESFSCSTEKVPVAMTSTRANEAHNTDHNIQVLVHPSGWKFRSFHRHILNERERKDLAAYFRTHLRQLFPSFSSTHPITEEDDDDLHWDNYKLHIPPMLFARDIMRFDFKDWGSVSMNAEDALFCWLSQHVPEVCQEHPLHVIQVPYAKKWASRLLSTASLSPSPMSVHHHITPSHGITPIQDSCKHVPPTTPHVSTPSQKIHHTTTSSSSEGSIPLPPPSLSGMMTPHAAHSNDGHPTLTSIRASDWTYSTDYCCTLLHTPTSTASASTEDQNTKQQSNEQRFVIHGQTFHRSNIFPLHHDHRSHAATEKAASYHTPWSVVEQSKCGIDYDMLRRRDLPILFYDEMTLYEDDLEDCGEISVEAKVRVMPNCWFALVRYFLRIDNVLVRCRETRMFHVFPTASLPTTDNEESHTSSKLEEDEKIVIHVEVMWREKNLEEDATLFPAATTMATAVPPTAASPATQAVLRSTASAGTAVPAALAKVMQGTAAAATARSAATATHTPSDTAAAAASHLAPTPPHLLPQRYTKENAGELLPRVNDEQHIPAYYTFTLHRPAPAAASPATSSNHEAAGGEHSVRHLHWFGLAAAHGVRK